MGARVILYLRSWFRVSYDFRKVAALAAALVLCCHSAHSQTPSASFTSNVFTGCAPLTVDFTNLSTNATNYVWSFGNGNTSTLQDPTTVYLTSGYYTVTLVAVNSLTGMRDTLIATNYINVVDNPVADFTAAPLSACLNNNVIVFSNASMNANQYTWDFGDGNTSNLPNPVHTYNSAGTFSVKLLAKNPWGCRDVLVRTSYVEILPIPDASFHATPQSTCDSLDTIDFTATGTNIAVYQWNFGDGNTSSGANPSHVYGASGSFPVSLVVTGNNGCTDTLVKPGYINIGSTLVPSFDVNVQSGCPPLNVSFTSTVVNGVSWSWDFGDGTTSALENPVHVYNTPGVYDITLTVTTSTGCDGTVILPGHIQVDNAPVPSFTVPSQTGCIPFDVTFNNTSSGGASFFWDFGDGFTSGQSSPQHTYSDTGSYDVTLTVTSANGCVSDTTIIGAISANSLTADFTGKPRVGCPPLDITLNGSSTPGAVTWDWDLGDGNTAATSTVLHTYTAIGNYNVRMIATSSAGCTDTIVKNNFFRVVDGTTNYTVPDTILVCTPPGTVTFSDPTFGSYIWSWHFGDGDSSNVKNPTHTYATPGIYTVTLTTEIAGGCVQVYNPYAIIEVLPFDVSPIQSIIINNCQPYQVQFSDTTSGVVSYFWDFGDGNTDTTAAPLHTYNQPGTYTVSLQITSVNGCTSNLSTTVTLGYSNPITLSSAQNCTGDTVQFGLTSGAFVSAIWDFGDGNTSGQLQPWHIYNAVGNYDVMVILTDSTACVDTFYFSPVNVGDPQPSFYVNGPLEGCVTFTANFVNTSTGASSYLWDFGIGNTSTVVNPKKDYGLPGSYTVSLTAYDNGCSRTVTYIDLITTYGAYCNFSFTQPNDCFPITVSFTDNSTAPVSWSWDFGDGNTSNVQNPVHVFTAPPSGQVTLTITDTSGCVSMRTKPNISYVLPDITADDTSGCRPHTVNFSSSTAATGYIWDFGDGTTASGSNVVHTFSDTGSFDITLSCILASGCTTTVSLQDYIEVNAPVAEFMSPVQAACPPTVVNFVNQSSGGAVSYLWDFGDGSTSTNSDPSNLYTSAGTYTVTLVATDTAGCTDTIVKPDYIIIPGPVSMFTLASQVNCLQTFVQFTSQSTNAVSWSWNFGDGYTSTLENPAHTYQDTGSYIVSLITTDSLGCSSYYVSPNPVVVYPDPVADGAITGSSGCAPVSISFTDNSTGATSTTWHFGNGDTTQQSVLTYSYTQPGIYHAFLVAVNQFGCQDTFQLTDSIEVFPQPVADFGMSVASGCAPLTVDFSDLSASLSGPVYNWSFGDGNSAVTQHPVHTFTVAGTYQVMLIVTNQEGCSDTTTQTVTVLPSPVASATVSASQGCTPFSLSLTDLSASASSWVWDFGDGSSSSQQNPVHTYTQPGTYSITLVVLSANGCSDTLAISTPVVVEQTPDASFTSGPLTGCDPLPVSFISTSSDLVNPVFSWVSGNGQSSMADSADFIYNMPGVYNASLVVVNSGGCSDTATAQVTVHEQAVADGTISQTEGCQPLNVSFTNNSQGATGYLWDFGDGTTSNDTTPSYIYTIPGFHQVTLIAIGSGGCSDTLLITDSVHVKPSPDASFVIGNNGNCTPVTVSTNNTSTAGPLAGYLWDYGNGNISTNFNSFNVYTQAGNYNISLVVTEEGGCTDTAYASITADPSPQALGVVSDSAGCMPFEVTFTSLSQFTDSLMWSLGDGTTSYDTVLSHTYSGSGTYSPVLIATNNHGCSDTLIIQDINVLLAPEAAFTVNESKVCFGETFEFTNSTVPQQNVGFLWNIGGLVTTAPEPQVTLSSAGIFNVTLIATHSNGCADTLTEPFYLQVYDSVPPPVSPILSVSVIDDTSIEVIWQNSASLDLGAYRLFRLNDITGQYDLIYTDNSPANSNISVTSDHVDSGLNTLDNTYTYKLQTVDQCDNARSLEFSVPHTSINVTASRIGQDVNVTWTPYQGCSVSSYEVTRTEMSSGAVTVIATVPSVIRSVIDSGFYCPDDFIYRVRALGLCGTQYDSWSDTSAATPANVLSLQKVDVVRTTVVNDSETLTEWLPPAIAPGRVIGYEIFRSEDGAAYVPVASLSPMDFSYIDYDVDVMEHSYMYRVNVLNDCNLSGLMSNKGTSILLRSEVKDLGDKLWWTEYEHWDSGVDHYIIEAEDENGQWRPVKKVGGNVNTILIK